jgi:hypothetical protein
VSGRFDAAGGEEKNAGAGGAGVSGGKGGKQVSNMKQLAAEWVVNIGEHAVDVFVAR